MTVLSCQGLRRSYGSLVAVDDASFDIAAGETYGLLRPNGAGKTTVISMVAGVLEAGTVTVDGHPITPRAARGKAAIGYVPQDVALYPDVTGRANLRFFGRLYGLRAAPLRARVDEVLETIGLSERAGDLVSK